MRKLIKAGIHISPNAVTAAFLSYLGQKPMLEKVLHFEASSLSQQLISLKKEVEKLNLKGVHASYVLTPSDYQIFLIDAPMVLESEKQDALRWAVSEYIDFPVMDAIIDFIELPQRGANEDKPKIYAVVAQKQRMEKIAAMVKETGLKLKKIDIAQNALRKIAISLQDSEQGQALLHLNEEKNQILIFKQKKIYMLRDLNVGDNYNHLALEIQRSIDFCANSLKNANVTRLVLTPQNHKNPELLTHLSNNLELPVREMDYSEILNTQECVNQNIELTCAIGTALRDSGD